MKPIRKVVIMPNGARDIEYLVTKRICNLLCGRVSRIYIPNIHETSKISPVEYFRDFPEDADVIIVIGGDGSVLDAGKYAIKHDIPIIGINKGHLGYLTQLEETDIEKLLMLPDGKYEITNRMLLSVNIGDSDNKEKPLAMNDFVLSHIKTGEMITFSVSDGGRSSLEYSLLIFSSWDAE